MRSLQDEIRQAQASLVCPICKRRFLISEIKLRVFKKTMSGELSVICASRHYPVILIVPVDLEQIYSSGQLTDEHLRFALQRIDRIKTLSEIVKG